MDLKSSVLWTISCNDGMRESKYATYFSFVVLWCWKAFSHSIQIANLEYYCIAYNEKADVYLSNYLSINLQLHTTYFLYIISTNFILAMFVAYIHR